ncbi:MAG: nucleotidyltransferase domain-containing protein [Pseudobdellovibrio sp.]
MYFFGSGYNGVFTSDSDLDLLLIVSNDTQITNMNKMLYSKRWSN